jgi:hypothetical protein
MKLSKDEIHKELDLIQEIIKRMASNSFEVKKWLIGILTAITVFKHEELLGGNGQFIWLLLIPILCFWYLDAYFLSTERLYREMYKWVVKYRSETEKYLYDLNTMTREFPKGNKVELNLKKNNILRVMLSETIWPFYIIPVCLIVVYAIVNIGTTAPHDCCCP